MTKKMTARSNGPRDQHAERASLMKLKIMEDPNQLGTWDIWVRRWKWSGPAWYHHSSHQSFEKAEGFVARWRLFRDQARYYRV